MQSCPKKSYAQSGVNRAFRLRISSVPAPALKSLNGFAALKSVGGFVDILYNSKLESLNGL
jgi:hypothetical protein